MYAFQFDKLACGTKRRISSGTVLMRLGDSVEVRVHLDVLLDASGLYTSLVDEFGTAPVFDISPSSLEPWQVDYFLCLAYSKSWKPVPFTKEMMRALDYFGAADYVYRNADFGPSSAGFPKDASAILDLLVLVDIARTKMPKVHAACLDALCRRRQVFNDEAMSDLSKETLLELLRIPARFGSPSISISPASSYQPSE